MNLIISDKWNDGFDDYFTVDIKEPDGTIYFVDVKHVISEDTGDCSDYYYVMDTDNGLEVYYRNIFGEPIGLYNLTREQEHEVLDYVLRKGNK